MKKILACLIGFLWLNTAYAQNAGNFVSYQKKGSDLLLKGTTGNLLIQSYTDDIFKVQFMAFNETPFDSSYTVVLKPTGSIGAVVEESQLLRIAFKNCTLEINKNPLKIALIANTLVKIKEINGIIQKKDSVYFSFNISPKDVFHGAGSRPLNLNLKGKYYDFYNIYKGGYYDDPAGESTGSTQSFNVPFILSSQKYGLLFDSNRPGAMRMYLGSMDSTKLLSACQSSGRWAYYLINGSSNDEILANYTLLTGRQPLPPKWMLGYIQSKFGYKTQEEAINVVDILQKSGFPIDALVLDLYWYGNETKMGDLDWDYKQWPNPTKMLSDFRAKGIKTIVINDPYVTTDSYNLNYGIANKLFGMNPATNQALMAGNWNGTTALFDIFKPETQAFIWQKLRKVGQDGVEGLWSDKNEPDLHPLSTEHVIGNALQVHNLYPLVWAKVMYENFRKDFPEKRIFNLIRSGSAGAQRYGIVPWSGDVLRAWTGLKLQVCIMLQMGMSGIAYMHSDTGGFYTPNNESEKNDELDMRWQQFSAFSPVFRTHGWRSHTEPYNLSQPYYDYAKSNIKTRYKLMPYLYTLAWQNSVTGRPICMPMDYFETNQNNNNILDQYFFGENMVVAPIFVQGAKTRKVLLPKGKWYNIWTNEIKEGEITENLLMNNIPVYAKMGSIIPFSNANVNSSDYYLSDSLNLQYFHDISVPTTTFSMYHDDGVDPNALSNKRYELINFTGKTNEDTLLITSIRQNAYDKSLAKRNMLISINNLSLAPINVAINGQNISVLSSNADLRTAIKPTMMPIKKNFL